MKVRDVLRLFAENESYLLSGHWSLSLTSTLRERPQ